MLACTEQGIRDRAFGTGTLSAPHNIGVRAA